MKKAIIEKLKKDSKFIKKDIFENLFRLIIDYQLSAMFGKKGFKLKDHIDFMMDMVTGGNDQPYIDYIRENTLKAEEPAKFLKAVQLILSNVERYLWFWIEDHEPNDLLQNLLNLSEIFNQFRDKLALEKLSNDIKLEPPETEENGNVIGENRFFLYKKTREIKDYFESVLESTTDAVISTDTNGKIVLFNGGAARMFGYDPDEVFHKTVDFLYVNPDDGEALKESLIAGGGKTHSFESVLKTRDGNTFPALISASLLKTKNDSATGIVRYIKNISEIKELEKELRQLSDFKSRHLHNISHEIKTPIATIIGFIDIISNYYEKTLDINVQRYMQKIKSTSQVLLDLMDTLLDLSKIESGKLELKYSSFNPADILEEVKIIFLPLLSEKGIDFTANNSCTVTVVTADRPRLRQVIFNLVSNAVKYTPESGKVALYLSNDENNLMIQVNDTGRGIPEENLNKIYDEFFQAAAAGEGGYGLGLALAKHIIDLHGGVIELESKENIGSKFKVNIPLKPMD